LVRFKSDLNLAPGIFLYRLYVMCEIAPFYSYSLRVSTIMPAAYNITLQNKTSPCQRMYSHSTFQIFFSDANIIIIIYDHLWSATKHHLIVPRYRLSTFGRRALSVAGPMVWKSLADNLRDPALSSNSFRQSLKTKLFRC